MNKLKSFLPIGVFDSGIGGVTVLKTLAEKFPHENFIYLGDTARLPYGSKSSETISSYSLQNIEYLFNRGVKAIVIACSSASSHCPIDMFKGVPIYNVITPGAHRAIQVTKSGRIGIFGTRATVNSLSYANAILRLNPDYLVFQQACPLFVPLAEEGLIEDEVTNIIATRYLKNLLNENVDTIILGCTHYPILKPTLQKLAPPEINWVDSGQSMALILEYDFQNNHLQTNKNEIEFKSRTIEVVTTDSSDQFIKMAEFILSPLSVNKFSMAHLTFSNTNEN